MADYMTKLDQLHERRGTIVGVPTGFTDLDRLTGGLQRSDLIILAARPAVGKTSLALSLAHNSAMKHGQSIAVFSLEMSKEQLIQRLLSMDAAIDQQRLRTGWIEDRVGSHHCSNGGSISSQYLDRRYGWHLHNRDAQ